jgi:hypothetical protein
MLVLTGILNSSESTSAAIPGAGTAGRHYRDLPIFISAGVLVNYY